MAISENPDHSNDMPQEHKAIHLVKKSVRLDPDPARVITRPFFPGGEVRIKAIINRVLSLSDGEVSSRLEEVHHDFTSRHKDITRVFEEHFEQIAGFLNHRSDTRGSGATDDHRLETGATEVSNERKQLIGAYFTCEYSLESVALFNPSIVMHPVQGQLDEGAVRFIMSLRACGEGHISSIEFRTGIIDASHNVVFDPVTRFVAAEKAIEDALHEKQVFRRKLEEMGDLNSSALSVLNELNDLFTVDELAHQIEEHRPSVMGRKQYDESAATMLWLARSNYNILFPADSAICERVIFPISDNESRGIEDARFVRFVHDDGAVFYYATYAAYNGVASLPQLIETADFRHFKILTLMGEYVQDKGMALFPRRIKGRYFMVARIDGQCLYLMDSDNLLIWSHCQKLRCPTEPWEFIQIGNCGSPIETPAGWLLLTHGVGPMREYCMGAMLLDLDDPSHVLGRLREPILVPAQNERNGYVPNVVYSCGSMIHNSELIIPYALSDTATRILTVPVQDLLAALGQHE